MPYLTTKRGLRWHYALDGQGPALVFIHGWSVDHRIWRQQIKHFRATFQVLAVDLPGHGQSAWQPTSTAQMAEDLQEILQTVGINRCRLVASSFGGLVALRLVERWPRGVEAVSFVGGLPKFLKSQTQPYGLDIERIRRLSGQVDADHAAILPVFFRSLFTKEERQTRRFRWIQRFRRDVTYPLAPALRAYLDLLEREDLTEVLREVASPVQFINGEGDPICNAEAVLFLRKTVPSARFDMMPLRGHFPFLSDPLTYNQLLERFLRTTLSEKPRPPSVRPARKGLGRLEEKARRAFSRMAAQYDAFSGLHREIGRELIHRLQTKESPSAILDVGMGTGWLTHRLSTVFPEARVVGVDFSPAMIAEARKRDGTFEAVEAAATALPFDEASFDVVTSNLAYQWVEDLSRAVKEAFRVLRPEGWICGTLFGFGTFQELFVCLEKAWGRGPLPIRRLSGEAEARAMLLAAGFTRIETRTETIQTHFSDMMALLKWIKGLGANALPREFYVGKDLLRRAQGHYQRLYAGPWGVDATLEVVWMKGEKDV